MKHSLCLIFTVSHHYYPLLDSDRKNILQASLMNSISVFFSFEPLLFLISTDSPVRDLELETPCAVGSICTVGISVVK